jgi:hypothetical protein
MIGFTAMSADQTIAARLSGVEGQAKAHETKLSQLNVNYKALYEHYDQSMEEVAVAIRKLNNGRKVQSVQFEDPMGKARDEDSLRSDHERLKIVVEEMRSEEVQRLGGAPSGWKPELESLKRKLADLEGNSGQMFSHKRLTFRTKQGVKAWVVENTVASPKMYWDLFSALMCMKPRTQSGRERADESYSAARTQSTTLENELLASMSHLRIAFRKTQGGVGCDGGRIRSVSLTRSVVGLGVGLIFDVDDQSFDRIHR